MRFGMNALFINKIKKLSIVGLVLALCGASCKEKEPVPEKIDVEFEVPASMTIDEGASEISFRVQFSKPPVSGDKIVLGSGTTEYACPVTAIADTRFSVSISDVWSRGFGPGTYSVSHQRGATKTKKGTMEVLIKGAGDIQPAEGVTVYGMVTCDGTGLANVVVSDGVEVVKTDSKGVYQMKSKKFNGYVFVSTPSGYEPFASGLLPNFHTKLRANPSTPERVDFQLKKADGQENHRMLMLGDIHLAARNDDQKQFKDFVGDINQTVGATAGKVYAMTLGDMTWDLYWLDNHYSYKEYLADAAGIKGVMLYHTIGNHDHSMYYTGDFDTVKEYKELIGPTYYSFNIGKVHYVVLDDVECTNSTLNPDRKDGAYVRAYDGHVVADELAWLKKDLAFVPNGTPLVVTMHIPLYNNKGQYGLKEASTLVNILKSYPEVHLYTAHTHTVYNKDQLETNDHLFEHNAGAICATWWWTGKLTPGVHICQDGTPGGYTLLDIAGTDFKWQYKATGKGTDYQFRTYDRNQIHITKDAYCPKYSGTDFKPSIWGTASSANEVYVNVWNWDPKWTVEVTENGKSLPVSQLVSGELDPLHYIAYTTKRFNSNAAVSFKTEKNYHLFKVTASSATSTLDIKVTDRFGNVYTETMTRPKAFTTETYSINN